MIVPPKGYLARLREICNKHGILLIFDEVITGFGRLGTPFAADFFGVKPDMITFAKAVNNAAVPLAAPLPQRIDLSSYSDDSMLANDPMFAGAGPARRQPDASLSAMLTSIGNGAGNNR